MFGKKKSEGPTIAELASRDAAAGVESRRERVVASVGRARPDVTTAGRPEHQEALARGAPKLNEYQDDLRRIDHELAEFPWSATSLKLALGGCAVAEFVASMLLFRALGVDPAQRYMLAFSLTCTLIFFTFLMAGRNEVPAPTDQGLRSWRTKLRRLLLPLAYSLLFIAVAVTRSRGIDDEGGVDWAVAIISLAVAVGPAWVAEAVIRALKPVARIAKIRRRLVQEQKETQKAVRKAQKFVAKRSAQAEKWDADAALDDAKYQTQYRLARALVERESNNRKGRR